MGFLTPRSRRSGKGGLLCSETGKRDLMLSLRSAFHRKKRVTITVFRYLISLYEKKERRDHGRLKSKRDH